MNKNINLGMPSKPIKLTKENILDTIIKLSDVIVYDLNSTNKILYNPDNGKFYTVKCKGGK